MKREQGFTLVELAIVFVIIGVLVTGGIATLQSVYDDVRYKTTQQRLEGVAQAVAKYAQQNYYLPCPADPSATPITGQSSGTFCFNFLATGIVPYKDLGLTMEQAKDSYGNWISYSISTNYNASMVLNGNYVVQNPCRVNNIWATPPNGTTPGKNKNLRKAMFCCQAYMHFPGATPYPPLRVTTPAGQDLGPTWNTTVNGPPDPTLADQVNPTSITAATNTTQAIVLVLVSHGKNAYGAFKGDGTYNRIAGPTTGRNNEIANVDVGTRIFVSAPFSKSQSNYYDDLIVWRTQDQLLSTFGREGCARP